MVTKPVILAVIGCRAVLLQIRLEASNRLNAGSRKGNRRVIVASVGRQMQEERLRACSWLDGLWLLTVYIKRDSACRHVANKVCNKGSC
jgi:hypothetical protein